MSSVKTYYPIGLVKSFRRAQKCIVTSKSAYVDRVFSGEKRRYLLENKRKPQILKSEITGVIVTSLDTHFYSPYKFV